LSLANLGRFISAQSTLPWAHQTWLGDGHTVPCDLVPGGAPFSAVLLLHSPPGAPELEMPGFRGDATRVLWMLPITDLERQWAVDHGSDWLKSKLWAAGAHWTFRPGNAAC